MGLEMVAGSAAVANTASAFATGASPSSSGETSNMIGGVGKNEFLKLLVAQLPADKDERKAGRDHNKNAFCTWMAGAGVKGGTTYGATDELGLAAVEDRVGVPDWHATILHLLGLRHDKLSVEINGLEERLTGVEGGRVVKGILA